MLSTHRYRSGWRRRGVRDGFTLVEVLVALAVIGVATWLILSLYSNSLKMEKSARSMRVASDLASARLADITTRPQAYTWPASDAVTVETPLPLPLKAAPGPEAESATPRVTPTNALAAEREKNFYEKFTWEALVKRPAEGRGFYEVLVVVRWQEAQRPQQVVMTGSIPVAMTKEAS